MAPNPAAPPELTIEAAAKFFSTTETDLQVMSRKGILPRIKAGMLPWIETTQKLVAYLRNPWVNTYGAAELLGKDEKWIRKLIADNYLPRDPDGRILRDDVFRGYIKFLTDDKRGAGKNLAENRVRDARAREIEMRTALRAGELCYTAEAVAAMQSVCGEVRSEFGGLAPAFTRDLVERRRLDKEVNARFNRIDARLAEEIAALGSSEGHHPGAPGDHPGPLGNGEQDLSGLGGASGPA